MLSLAVAAFIALALAMIVRSASTVKTTTAVPRAALGTLAAGGGAPQLAAGYRSMTKSKLAALGIVRNPKTGLWMCNRVARRTTVPSGRTSLVDANPWHGLLR